MNALNLQMRDELWTVIEAVRDDPSVRVLIIRGAGDRAFSAGADVSEFGTASSYIEARRRRERDLWQLTARPRQAAHRRGARLRAGRGLRDEHVLRHTSRGEDARLGLPEMTLGYVPSAGGTQMLPRTIGRPASR